MLAGQLERVETIWNAGVRMLTLTWNGPNELASGHDTPGDGEALDPPGPGGDLAQRQVEGRVVQGPPAGGPRRRWRNAAASPPRTAGGTGWTAGSSGGSCGPSRPPAPGQRVAVEIDHSGHSFFLHKQFLGFYGSEPVFTAAERRLGPFAPLM